MSFMYNRCLAAPQHFAQEQSIFEEANVRCKYCIESKRKKERKKERKKVSKKERKKERETDRKV